MACWRSQQRVYRARTRSQKARPDFRLYPLPHWSKVHRLRVKLAKKKTLLYCSLKSPIRECSIKFALLLFRCCPVNCAVGQWSSWGSCNAACEKTGNRARTRTVTTQPACKGTPCPTLRETKACQGPCCPRDCQVSITMHVCSLLLCWCSAASKDTSKDEW